LKPAEQFREQVPSDFLGVYEAIKNLIEEEVPDATTCFKWGMLHFDHQGDFVALSMRGNYLCLYLMDTELVQRFSDQLKGINKGKNVIRLKSIADIQENLFREMLATAR